MEDWWHVDNFSIFIIIATLVYGKYGTRLKTVGDTNRGFSDVISLCFY
jgi:hypothetical protein